MNSVKWSLVSLEVSKLINETIHNFPYNRYYYILPKNNNNWVCVDGEKTSKEITNKYGEIEKSLVNPNLYDIQKYLRENLEFIVLVDYKTNKYTFKLIYCDDLGNTKTLIDRDKHDCYEDALSYGVIQCFRMLLLKEYERNNDIFDLVKKAKDSI